MKPYRFALIALLFASSIAAQRPPDMKLDAATNRAIVAGVVRAVDKYYLSAEVAGRVRVDLEARSARGEYDRITSAYDLMDAVDKHLQTISRDRHLGLAYSHQPSLVSEGQPDHLETPVEREAERQEAIRHHFGFDKVEVLEGNVGYINMRRFVRPVFSGERTGAVMDFVAETDALIIDLRNSSGGSADMVVFLASYFFPGDEPRFLAALETRVEKRSQQLWTFPYVPGARYLDKEVYILISERSFSAVEGFTALLQHHHRATVVGEKTRGGTHPGMMVKVHPNFAVFVPMSYPVYPTGTPESPLGRPVYPSMKADLEGTGVTPDIPVPASQALQRAHLEALQRKVSRDPGSSDRLEPILARLKNELETPRK